ncbi:MAG: DUF4907 domain-containing protein [Bacteroidetes bacterium]|nr:DUF4907 domain-containing protein [Bacteroidota bacterium]
MKFYRSVFLNFNFVLFFFTFLLFSSCDSPNHKNGSDPSQSNTGSSTSAPSNGMELKTFEVKDSKGISQGWGYDIYVNGKKIIHQPIMPAVPGNNSFKTENDAQKVGSFAVDKMLREGALPTILIKELDSLGVLK